MTIYSTKPRQEWRTLNPVPWSVCVCGGVRVTHLCDVVLDDGRFASAGPPQAAHNACMLYMHSRSHPLLHIHAHSHLHTDSSIPTQFSPNDNATATLQGAMQMHADFRTAGSWQGCKTSRRRCVWGPYRNVVRHDVFVPMSSFCTSRPQDC